MKIDSQVKGELVAFENETYYKISSSDKMRPFFITLVSDANHWMFISSNGGLTAGRKNAEFALFPYYTDDKITEMAETTGSKTIFQIHLDNKTIIWEPFSIRQFGQYNTQTNIFKSIYGNKIVFEEVNIDLGLTFRYQWNSSNAFGFVKKSTLINHLGKRQKITVLDGLQNVLPATVSSDLQNSSSNLVDAYKRSELDVDSKLGIYALSAVIVDKAEPSESLKANTIWCSGFSDTINLLSSLQLNDFRRGLKPIQETDIKAEKGAYFVVSDLELQLEASKTWQFVANVNQSVTECVNLVDRIKNDPNLEQSVQDDIALGTKNLIKLTGAADGLQKSNDELFNIRHFSNTLFNIMRGGIFDDNYNIERADFSKYLKKANSAVFNNSKFIIEKLPEVFTLNQLKAIANQSDDADFKRLALEYLPLKFSRRHGDPSRPWNKFSINTQSEVDGSKILDYQGNWRDIFQNWEALAHAYPEFIEGMIFRFLNASTFDGYNPYRVTKDGFDWEVVEAHDPWSYIGYWGDHQIIYLLKFLEFIEAYYPGKLEDYFADNMFVYANVPYKIKPYADILNNPKDTIEFDYDLEHKIQQERLQLGADAALLKGPNGAVYHVNMLEKLLATVLAKLSNFIPEAGIWMNTQRPEWNDANNALVGNGVSMVTLYYLNRFFNFFDDLITKSEVDNVEVSKELFDFFTSVKHALQDNEHLLDKTISNESRKIILDALGESASHYRESIYENGFSNTKQNLSKSDLVAFIQVTRKFLAHSIEANKRDDNLYHAYNLMTVDSKSVTIDYLTEMLEGQVAVLSSGYLNTEQSLSVLDALKASALFREDQYSYILYPNKDLPKFFEKNNISESQVEKSVLLKQLVDDGNKQIIEQDQTGQYHFNSNFNNANSLKEALDHLDSKYAELVESDRKTCLDIFEDIFNHKAFTGRSGTFFGYEGLGSIYWHMVSKLLLAVQENCWLAINSNASDEVIGRLLEHYYEIQAGIGVHKSPELYGAFPTDAYSHTPATKGAQQPGMTGQVKEDVLTRLSELGVYVKSGQIYFNTRLLRASEFLEKPSIFSYTDVLGNMQDIELPEESLCFTYAQVPIVYKCYNYECIEVLFYDGTKKVIQQMYLEASISKSIFERRGEVKQITVCI